MIYLVDTDVIIDWLLNIPLVIRTLQELEPSGLAISLATYGQLLAGVPNSRNPEASEHAIRAFLRRVRILPLSRPVVERFARLKADLSPRGQLIGDFDTLIAATALHHGLTIVTRNRKDFERVPDLPLHVPS